MNVAQIVGVDPGLVDTGVVAMTFKLANHSVYIEHTVISGTDPQPVKDWIYQPGRLRPAAVFVEKYRPRQRLDTDVRMVQAEQGLRRALPEAVFLQNMGIKNVISTPLMEVLGVWSWPTVTHHQDLRSAARIALLGMVKNRDLNRIVADVVKDHLANNPWQVTHG